MELKDALLPGGGGLILGLLLGVAVGGSGEDLAKASLKQSKAVSEKLAAFESDVAGLGTKIEGIEGALKTQGDGVAGLGTRIEGIEGALKTQGDGVAALGSKIDGVVTSVQGGFDKFGGGVSEAVKTEIAGLKSDLASLAQVAAKAAPASVAAVAPVAVEGKAAAPGATVVFDKDKLRVFVSGVDTAAGVARVAVNGRDLMMMKVHQSVAANGCTVELNGFNADGQAVFGGGCEAGTTPAETGPRGVSAPVVEGEGVAPGATVVYDKDKLRVFVSGVDTAAGVARVAVNGRDLTMMKPNEPFAANGCSVELKGFNADGKAVFEGGCGADTTPAETGTQGVAAAVEGEGVGPGATIVFDKDKLRIFVSAANPSDGSARVAINGRDLMLLKVKEPYTANGCTVELSGFNADGKAVFGGGC